MVVLVLKWRLPYLNDDFQALFQIKIYMCGNQIYYFGMIFCVQMQLHMLNDVDECYILHMCLILFFLK